MNRRQFLTSTAVGATALAAASSPEAYARDRKPIRVGVVGCGWFGMYDLFRLMDVAPVRIVGLCDVDKAMRDGKAKEVADRGHKDVATFHDYRDLLKPGALDVCIVGTPDHWHCLPTLAALQAGADVYVEKPTATSHGESRLMLSTARKLGRVVQVGTQRRSTRHIAEACAFVRGGEIGHVGLTRAYCYYGMRGEADPADAAPPPGLDFEFWTGPAPKRPFNPLLHPKQWRKFTEYGNGILGDMGVHMLDVARFGLGVGHPKSVFSTGGTYALKKGKPNIPDTQTVTYDYGDRTVMWEHRAWGGADEVRIPWGVNFYGEKGTVSVTLDDWKYVPHGKGLKERGGVVERDDQPTREPASENNIRPANRAHWRNFLDTIGSRGKPVADIEQGHISSTLCFLGNLSLQLGRSLKWDAAEERVAGDDEANKLLTREYRKPWALPVG